MLKLHYQKLCPDFRKAVPPGSVAAGTVRVRPPAPISGRTEHPLEKWPHYAEFEDTKKKWYGGNKGSEHGSKFACQQQP
ncbi:hypothetical protein [Thalassospira marina]|uniref:hypothetical protein n=1 Tax=Thalassospira marina TaxID=2048283 RepID=UPI0020C33713|nr:hypothetical protein [Thalassospira marina]